MSSLFPDSLSRPYLPPFRTLLVKGPYHPSAPIHLCFSHTRTQPHPKTVLLTPSRLNFKRSLEEYNDDWLTTNSGLGKTAEISSRIEVFYPPSPAHLKLFLSMIRTYDPSDGTQYEAKTTVEAPPTLIVLHEPSTYFLGADTETSYTVSSYLSLVAHTLASITFLSAHNDGNESISFALFDSQLDRLKLPVLRSPRISNDPEEDVEQSPRLESVAGLVQKYFEWVALFDKLGPASDEEGDVQNIRRNRLRLYQTVGPDEDRSSMWHWIEHDGPEKGSSDRRGIVFSWP